MKVIAFAQLHEEQRKGNLENWYRSVAGCDHVYVFDQGSRDGSIERYAQDPRTVVIPNMTNDFARELECKATLLEMLLADHPDVDWIFWLDGDTILDGRLLRDDAAGFKNLCRIGVERNLAGVKFGHYNLWRSDTWYRTDARYHGLHAVGRCALWRNNGKLRFARRPGLHLTEVPEGLGSMIQRVDFSLIHRGFATDDQILEKHRIYASHGQKGDNLDRLLDEHTLAVSRLPGDVLPTWFQVRDGGASPIGKRPIIELARVAT